MTRISSDCQDLLLSLYHDSKADVKRQRVLFTRSVVSTGCLKKIQISRNQLYEIGWPRINYTQKHKVFQDTYCMVLGRYCSFPICSRPCALK